MEKLAQKTEELIRKLEGYVGDDYIYYFSLVTYIFQNWPIIDYDFMYFPEWFTNIENEISSSYCSLKNISADMCENNNSTVMILGDILFDAFDMFNFYDVPELQYNEDFKSLLYEFANNIDENELKSIIKRTDEYLKTKDGGTPSSVCRLSKALLDIQIDDSLCDLCVENGEFLSSVDETKNIVGFDINMNSLKSALVRCIINGVIPAIAQQDVLLLNGGNAFDKVFCSYPWGQIYNRSIQLTACEKWKPLPIKDVKRSMMSWLFISKALSLIKETGMVVVYTNDGPLWSTYESDIRINACKLGLVNSIIKLPAKLNLFTSVSSSIMVLSKGNSGVRFVDASNFGSSIKTSRIVELTDKDIEGIVALVNQRENTENSVFVSNERIIANNGNLNVNAYLYPDAAQISIKDGKKIGDISSEIIKSAVMNSALLGDNPSTGIRVLASGDIQNGMVDINKLPYLTESGKEFLSKNWESGLLQDGDVIMTNKSTTIKSAVVDTNGEKIVLFGSLFGLRIDKNVMYPEYLSCFINSNAGQTLLKSIQTGTTISMITLANLKSLEIPCPSLEKQKALCDSVAITLDMIKEAKERVVKLQKQYEGSFDDLFKE